MLDINVSPRFEGYVSQTVQDSRKVSINHW